MSNTNENITIVDDMDFREVVLDNLKSKDMNALKILLNEASELDLLNIVQELSDENQAIVYRLLSKDNALFVFEQLEAADQEQLLKSFTEKQAIEMITELDPDDRVKLLDELPAAVAKRMLAALSPEEREATSLLMGYEAQTAGRIMTPEYVRLHKKITASQALEKVRENARAEKETIYTLYITDEARKLEGVLSLRDLLVADAADTVESIMRENPVKVSTDDDQEEVARTLQKMDLLSIPVVDKEDRLVGIITVDDAMDVIEEETTEDIYNQAGLIAGKEANRSEVLIHGGLWSIWKVRLPFLFITIVAGMLAAVVLEGFEEVLESIAAVAFFIPLIMDMGGNVGTQSSTVFARGVVLGHIHMKSFFKHLLKEVGVGVSLGAVSGLISGAIAAIWQGDIMFGFAVGLAVTFTMTLAALLGFLVPFILTKLNVDQAAGSAPIITSVKDISGILIYFTLVITLLGHLVE